MRIESLAPYKYFFQLIREEPLHLKRYSLFLILIPLLFICYLYDWNPEILLFLSLAYLSAAVGFMTAYTYTSRPSASLKKQFYYQLIAENLGAMLILVNNRTRKILFANPAFYEGLGFAQESSPIILLEDFIDLQDIPHLRKDQIGRSHRKGALSVQPIASENEAVQVRKQNGDLIWVTLSAKMTGEQDAYTIYQLTDVTEKVLREKATSQFAKDLLQRKSSLKALKRKEAEVILMMNLERSKMNS